MGELAAFDGDDGSGLDMYERAMLTHLIETCVELKERDKTRNYLEWGKYLVDRCIVSDYTDEEGNNILAPPDPQNEPLELPLIPEAPPLSKRRARKEKGLWIPPDK